MKNARLFTVKLLMVALTVLFVFAGCKKATENTAAEEKSLLDKSDVTLLQGMGLSGFNINDTANNIKGKVVFARNLYKDDDNKNIKPANEFWEKDLKEFAEKVKALQPATDKDTNLYVMQIRSIVEFEDVMSVVYEKTTHFIGTKDTVKELKIYNYDEDSGKELSFFSVFDVNRDNLSSFNKLFDAQFTLDDLRSMQFYFTKDKFVLINDTKSAQGEKSVAKKAVKKYLIDD